VTKTFLYQCLTSQVCQRAIKIPFGYMTGLENDLDAESNLLGMFGVGVHLWLAFRSGLVQDVRYSELLVTL
jgi:hypothetical protein